ncbi:MAG: phosphatase PAP2-related protein [Candidatus Moraniibacteriota bacterium]
MMKKLFSNHKNIWQDKDFLTSLSLGFLFLFISFIINYYAGLYATSSQSNAVSDIILDHLPVYNVNFIFFEGFSLLWVFVISILVYKPRAIPFTIKNIAIFILIRAAFITLTHLKESPNYFQTGTESMFQNVFTFGGDLFFSAHTGLPFLLALVFWKNKKLRLIFLVTSIVFAVSMLLGHLHYSIDVFAAFFITYSIYKIAQYFFAKDYQLFLAKDS